MSENQISINLNCPQCGEPVEFGLVSSVRWSYEIPFLPSVDVRLTATVGRNEDGSPTFHSKVCGEDWMMTQSTEERIKKLEQRIRHLENKP